MLLLLVLFVIIVYFYQRNKKVKAQCDYLPGPETYPFFGNGLELSAGGPEDYFATICRYWEKYGSRFRMFIGEGLAVMLSDPKDVEVILTSQTMIEKSRHYDLFKPWLGTGLLTSTGEKWKKQRRVITPAFHFKILDHFVQVFDDQSEIFIGKLKINSDNNKEFNIYSYITLCALDIICESAMGVSVNAQQDSESEYVKAVKNACNIINERIRSPLMRSDKFFKFTDASKVLQKSLDTLHGYTDSMILQRRKLLEISKESFSSYIEDTEDNIYGAKKKMAFLDLLLLSTVEGRPLSDLEIREEVDTFLFEGHDTVSSAIGFAIYVLSKHRDIQEKLFKEQLEIFTNDFSRPITHSDLQNMKYLELVIKETLRLYPSVPIIGRKLNEETMINDMRLPKNTSLVILCYSMNRNPEVFPDPEKFKPERFTMEESNKRSPFSSVFFSAGPRNCIGQKFAMLEIKSTLSKLIRNFVIWPTDEKLVLSADIILKSVNGIKVRLTSRK